MESEEEQHMTTLLCMGFSDPATIRKALRLAKNDINEAVALLTNERPGLDYGGYEPMDSGGPSPGPGGGPRGDGGGDGGGPSRGGSTGGSGGFDPPPAYHEVVDAEVSGAAPDLAGEAAALESRGQGTQPAGLPAGLLGCRDNSTGSGQRSGSLGWGQMGRRALGEESARLELGIRTWTGEGSPGLPAE